MADALTAFLALAVEDVLARPVTDADAEAAQERLLTSYVLPAGSTKSTKSRNEALELGVCAIGSALRDSAEASSFVWQPGNRNDSLPAAFVGSGLLAVTVDVQGARTLGIAVLRTTQTSMSVTCHSGPPLPASGCCPGALRCSQRAGAGCRCSGELKGSAQADDRSTEMLLVEVHECTERCRVHVDVRGTARIVAVFAAKGSAESNETTVAHAV